MAALAGDTALCPRGGALPGATSLWLQLEKLPLRRG